MRWIVCPGFGVTETRFFYDERDADPAHFRQVYLTAGISLSYHKLNIVFRMRQPDPAAADVHDGRLYLAFLRLAERNSGNAGVRKAGSRAGSISRR